MLGFDNMFVFNNMFVFKCASAIVIVQLSSRSSAPQAPDRLPHVVEHEHAVEHEHVVDHEQEVEDERLIYIYVYIYIYIMRVDRSTHINA